MSYTEAELSNLIKSVEEEFSAHLNLAKSEEAPPEKEEEHKEEPKEEKKEDKKDEPKGESEESHEEPKEDKEEAKEEAAPEKEEGEAKEEPKSENGDECDYDDDDHAQMAALYQSMGKGELKAHHDAIKNCLDAHKAPEKEEAKPEMGMEKSEDLTIEVPAAVTEEMELLKSEFAAEKAKSEQLQKSLDMVQELLTKMVKKSVPQARAITSMEVIEKSEAPKKEVALSKSEITEKLNAAARTNLQKSDRDAINAYCLGLNPNIESIRHLLK